MPPREACICEAAPDFVGWAPEAVPEAPLGDVAEPCAILPPNTAGGAWFVEALFAVDLYSSSESVDDGLTTPTMPL